MASAEIEPTTMAQKIPRNLFSALVSAFLEWFLIVSLFIGAGVSYVITKFARDFKLQTPCLLCSRLDHVLGKEKTGYHWDLMCKHHKSEISSLVHCHAHNKLVDVHKMCENCLFSFATVNKSNAETYRLLVGKLGEEFNSESDSDSASDHDDSVVEDENVGFMRSKKCACCDQPWAPKGHARAKELIHTRFAVSEAGEVDTAFSDSADLDLDREATRNVRDRSMSLTVSHSRQFERDHLPHIGYMELKINSDTESEALHSEDDAEDRASARANIIHERVDFKEELSVRSVEPRVVVVNEVDLALEKLLDLETEPMPSLLKSEVKEGVEMIELVDCKIRGLVSPVNQEENAELVDGKNQEQELQLKEDEEAVQLVDSKAQEEESQVKCDGETIELVESKAREKVSQVKCDGETFELVESKARGKESQLKSDGEAIELVDYKAREQESQEKEDVEIIQLIDCKAQEEESQVAHAGETVELIDCITRDQESQVIKIDEKTELLDNKAKKSTVTIMHGLEELNWQEVGNEAVHITTSLPSDALQTTVEVPQSSYVARIVEVEEASVVKFEETAETSSETNAARIENGHQATNSFDLGDAYKLAIDTRGKQPSSGVIADQWLGKDSSKATEDLKILLSQLSANRGFELPYSDTSPKLSVNSDDTKSLDHSNSFGMQRLQKRISLERNESGLSLDGSIISDIDGESAVDRVKRQLDHDKRLMAALYKELEEERSASAVATNQAMAMITRLQEEKAALHMEALQYLRMMEEQAEYDDDELQKSNDLLAEREKEVQDLEAELEFYKKKFPNERYLENFSETSGDMRITDIGVDNSEQYYKNVDSLIPELEEEKAYILQALERLEKTLDLHNDDELSPNIKNRCDYSEEHDTSVSGQNSIGEGNHLSLDIDNSDLVKQNFVESSEAIDLASVGVMVSGLNKRLEALEADRRFLEHTINSLRNGEEGVQFVQEIASHLRELRRIAMRKDQVVA